jgi:hypothetical protein
MTKNLAKKIIIGSIVLGGLAGLTGCYYQRDKEMVGMDISKPAKKEKKEAAYFSESETITTYPAMGSSDKVDMALGDIDGDGDLDVLTAASGRVKYSENLGDGRFADRGTIVKYPALGSQDEVALDVGDMDNDGDLDISVATSGRVKYFENNIPQKNKIKEGGK